MEEIERLLIQAEDVLSNGELVNEIRRIKDAYDEMQELLKENVFGHIFSGYSIKKFERAISISTKDKEEGFQTYVHKMLEQKNITQSLISDRSGIDESTLNRYINGSRSPSVDTVFRIALALRLSLVETEALLRKLNMGFKSSAKDAVIIEAIKQKNFDYLAVEAVLRYLTNGEESILTKKEKELFSDDDLKIEIED